MTRTHRLVIALALTALGTVGACGDRGGRTGVHEAPEEYVGCDVPMDRKAEDQAVCDSYLSGLKHGTIEAYSRATLRVARKTSDGYRLRRWVSLVIVALGLWMAGTVAAAWLVTVLQRRRGAGYGSHVATLVATEAEAVRDLGRAGDALVRDLVERIKAPLAEVERQARTLAEHCAPLEAKTDNATSRAHLESLYHKLDDLVTRSERLHVQVTVWSERIATEDDDGALERELELAIQDLEEAMAEVL